MEEQTLISKWSRLRDLTWAERGFLLTAWALLPIFWLALRCFGLARLQGYSGSAKSSSAINLSIDKLMNYGQLVNSASAYSLGPATCLSRSLLLRWLLQRRNVETDVRIGVRTIDGRLDAHAWVEFDGQPINDAPDVGEHFAAFSGPSPPAMSSFS